MWLRRIMNPITYSCKEATLLLAKRDESKLKNSEKIRLKLHLLFCDLCRSFDRQMGIIEGSIKHNCKEHEHLSTEFKRNLEDILK